CSELGTSLISMRGPCSTLFRSDCVTDTVFPWTLEEAGFEHIDIASIIPLQDALETARQSGTLDAKQVRQIKRALLGQSIPLANRSEEHTSELQSRVNLVCSPPL